MKKIFFILLLLATISFYGKAQTEENKYTIGFDGGITYNVNAYQIAKNANYGNNYYGVSPRYNIGVDYGYNVSNRFRPRIEFKYVSVMYGLDFSNTIYNITDKDFVTVNYFDINLHFDYLLLTIKNFQLFASPALKYEFELNAYPEVNWSPYLNMEHPGNLLGGAIAPIFKYNLSDHLGLTLTPEYTIFLEPFASGNSKPYYRYSGNFGIEYKFGD